jgi:hypothetical protein
MRTYVALILVFFCFIFIGCADLGTSYPLMNFGDGIFGNVSATNFDLFGTFTEQGYTTTNLPTMTGMIKQYVGMHHYAWVSPTSLWAAVTNEVDPLWWAWYQAMSTGTAFAITNLGGFYGPGSGLLDVNAQLFDGLDSPVFLLKQEAVSNFATIVSVVGKLDSNTWAAADSTTNFVRRTGDTMSGPLVTSELLYGPLLSGGSNIAVGALANGNNFGVSVGWHGSGENYGAALGRSVAAYDFGAGVGAFCDAFDHGVSVGFYSFGVGYGVSLGQNSHGGYGGVSIGSWSMADYSNIAVGVNSWAGGISATNRVVLGNSTTNSKDNSVAMRGTLYLDGGSNVYYRTNFGAGAWTALGAGAQHEISWSLYPAWDATNSRGWASIHDGGTLKWLQVRSLGGTQCMNLVSATFGMTGTACLTNYALISVGTGYSLWTNFAVATVATGSTVRPQISGYAAGAVDLEVHLGYED